MIARTKSARQPQSERPSAVPGWKSDCDDCGLRLPIAARLFRAAGYSGRQGETFWKAAALVRLGWITEAEAMSAATAATCATSSPPGYFRVTLAELVSSRGGDLTAMMRAARIVPRLPCEPPPEAARPERGHGPLKKPPPPKPAFSDGDTNDARNKLLEQLKRFQ